MKVEEPPKRNLEEHESLLMTSPLTWSSHHTTAGDKYCQTIQDIFVCSTFSPTFQKSLQSKISKKVSEHLDGNFCTNIMDINLATCASQSSNLSPELTSVCLTNQHYLPGSQMYDHMKF